MSIQVLDIGAWPEGAPRWEGMDVEVTGFEPVNPSGGQLPYFLGDGRTRTFYTARYRGCSSIFEPNADVIDQFVGIDATLPGGNFTVVGKSKVKTQRLNDVVETKEKVFDWVKIDTQGAELSIIKDGWDVIGKAAILEVEVEFVELYRNQPLAHDVMDWVLRKGWQFHKFVDIKNLSLRQTGLRTWMCGEAIFVNPLRMHERQIVGILQRAYSTSRLLTSN